VGKKSISDFFSFLSGVCIEEKNIGGGKRVSN
jgi:hypothetical protein